MDYTLQHKVWRVKHLHGPHEYQPGGNWEIIAALDDEVQRVVEVSENRPRGRLCR